MSIRGLEMYAGLSCVNCDDRYLHRLDTLGLLAEFFATRCQEKQGTRMPNIKVCQLFVVRIAIYCRLTLVNLIHTKVFSGSSHPDLAHKICDRFNFFIHCCDLMDANHQLSRFR